MQSGFGQRFLVVYSGVLTAIFAVTVLSGFVGTTTKKTSLDELTVQRINVVEPDGTLRMVIQTRRRSLASSSSRRSIPILRAPMPASSSTTTKARRTADFSSAGRWVKTARANPPGT